MSSNYFNLNDEAPSQALPSAELNSARTSIEMVPVQQYQPVVRPQIDQPTLRRVVKWEICLKVVAWILVVVGILIAVANFFFMFFVSDIVEDKPVSEDFSELYIWGCVVDSIKGWFMMGIGVKALKAIKRRSSKVSKRMMKHACCLAFMFILLTVVTIVLKGHMYKVGMPGEWEDKMWV